MPHQRTSTPPPPPVRRASAPRVGASGTALAPARTRADDLLFAASRTLHITAVLAAVRLKFRPAARAYVPGNALNFPSARGL